jgi:DNA-binding NtrC family response regulator
MVSGELKRILVADGDQELVKKLAGYLNRAGYEIKVCTSGAAVLEILEDDPDFDLVVTAMNLPEADGMEILRRVKSLSQSIPVVVLTSQGSVKRAVEAMQAGAADFLLKPVTVELMEELASRMLSTGKGKAISSGAGRPIVTSDPRMRNLLDMARAVADSRATVLVSGESGTGKELFARYLHENSSRRGAPFVAVNCASLPEGLLESELFGHEKGAFTGAINRKLGKFEMAEGGTILLDEISEMAVSLQAKLLRVLQENEIDRVGGKRPVPVDVRVVATTNRDMAEHIKSGDFREDLYYRLNVIPLKIPPLRERPEDILLLAQYFLEVYATENNRPNLKLSEETKRLLATQAWPGNVRELQNTMERAVLLSSDGVITPQALLFEDSMVAPVAAVGAGGGGATAGSADTLGLPPTLKEAERLMIDRALTHTDGNRTHAAKILGISVRTLRNKLNEYKEGKAP